MERSDFPISVRDATGEVIRLDTAPQRIVSLVPSLTELLAHLELEEEVVGLTRFCERPAGWREEKRIVGGTKNVKTDRVAELEPDLVIANREENERETVEVLRELAPAYVSEVATVEDALLMIQSVGRITGRAPEADALTSALRARFMEVPRYAPMRAAYLIWQEPFMTVGGDTFIHDVMRRAGFVNVFGTGRRYPEVTLDDLRGADPDVLLLSSEPFPFDESHAERLRTELPGCAVAVVDGQPFSWYGSRLLDTPTYIAELRERLADG